MVSSSNKMMALLAMSALESSVRAISWWKYSAWDYDLITCWADSDCAFAAWTATGTDTSGVDWSNTASTPTVCCAVLVDDDEANYARVCVQVATMEAITSSTAYVAPSYYVNKVFTENGATTLSGVWPVDA